MHPVVRALLFISIAAVIISAISTLFDLMWILINKSTRVRVDVAYLLFSVSAFWVFLLILIASEWFFPAYWLDFVGFYIITLLLIASVITTIGGVISSLLARGVHRLGILSLFMFFSQAILIASWFGYLDIDDSLLEAIALSFVIIPSVMACRWCLSVRKTIPR